MHLLVWLLCLSIDLACWLAAQGSYNSSTLFVDVLGPLSGASGTNFSSSAAREAVATQVKQVTDTVKAGYMVRASADWNVRLFMGSACSAVLSPPAYILLAAMQGQPLVHAEVLLA